MTEEWTYRQIAGELKVGLHAVWEYVNRYCKIKKEPPEMPARYLGIHYRLLAQGDPYQILAAMHRKMGTWNRVAKALKVSTEILRQYRRFFGMENKRRRDEMPDLR